MGMENYQILAEKSLEFVNRNSRYKYHFRKFCGCLQLVRDDANDSHSGIVVSVVGWHQMENALDIIRGYIIYDEK